jgi:hypothetical protein
VVLKPGVCREINTIENMSQRDFVDGLENSIENL